MSFWQKWINFSWPDDVIQNFSSHFESWNIIVWDKMREFWDRIFFIKRNPTLVRRHLYIEPSPNTTPHHPHPTPPPDPAGNDMRQLIACIDSHKPPKQTYIHTQYMAYKILMSIVRKHGQLENSSQLWTQAPTEATETVLCNAIIVQLKNPDNNIFTKAPFFFWASCLINDECVSISKYNNNNSNNTHARGPNVFIWILIIFERRIHVDAGIGHDIVVSIKILLCKSFSF